MTDLLLEPQELRLLEKLRLAPSRTFPGRIRGERITHQRGISIEFSDYREYGDGDDLRHMDWNVLARLDSPIIKTYRDEEDLAVHLLLDLSPSMDFGDPSKASAALRLAAALGCAALSGGDALYPRLLGDRSRPLGALRGRSSYPKFCRWLGSCSSLARPLSQGLRSFAEEAARPGLALIVSDGLDPQAPTALGALAARGHEVCLLLVLSPLEMDPDLEGDLRLLDSETQEAVEITANSATLSSYKRSLEAHLSQLKAAALKGGGRMLLASSSDPLSLIVQKGLLREGWLKA